MEIQGIPWQSGTVHDNRYGLIVPETHRKSFRRIAEISLFS